MGRLLAYLAFFLLVIGVCYGLTLVARHFANNRRQRLAAKFAPEMLRHENLPTSVVEAFIEQRRQLDAANAIFRNMVEDPFFDLTTQYHDLITTWLKGQQKKEISK